jgi:hypothetical protein
MGGKSRRVGSTARRGAHVHVRNDSAMRKLNLLLSLSASKRRSVKIIDEFHTLMCKRDRTVVHSPDQLNVVTNLEGSVQRLAPLALNPLSGIKLL